VWAARLYWLMGRAGFRRWSTYWQAAFAGLVTNIVFGFMRCAVLLTMFEQAARVAGYDPAAAVTFVWVGQGLLSVILLWGGSELAERVRSGDIAIDLLRPWDLQAALLAEDLGRAGFSVLIRFTAPMLAGALFYDLRLPSSPLTWLVFAVAVALAVVVSFGMRFLMNLTAFWLLDWRGVFGLYWVISGVLAGLVVPIGLFPQWARVAIWCTPFPAMVQVPADLLIERGPAPAMLAHQLGWAIALLLLGRVALRRGERTLVVQGG
jgi:ABC-2 type transport system permease protein